MNTLSTLGKANSFPSGPIFTGFSSPSGWFFNGTTYGLSCGDTIAGVKACSLADLAYSALISVSPPELATYLSSFISIPSFTTFEEALTYVSAISKFSLFIILN